MTRLTNRLEHDLREIAAGAHPSPSAWESIAARLDEDTGSEVSLAPALPIDRSKRPVWLVAAAAALAVITGSIAVLTGVGDDQPISTAGSDLTTTFESPRNGFSIRYPEGAVVTPAAQSWGLGAQVDDGFDVVETGSTAVFKGTSASEFPDGNPCHDSSLEEIPCGSIDEQVDRYLSQEHLQFDGCAVPRSQQAVITIDGQSGRVAECPNLIEATVVTPGRLYLFTMSHNLSDARAVFDAFTATIDLTPETAISFAAMTTTFVSPTYGLSFKHFDRKGITPAAEPWDPATQQVDSVVRERHFDEVETGSGAIFAAASIEIPNGVSIDAWVDEYVGSPAPRAADGCGVPRSTQAEITIDGQPGRTVECPNRAEATVVAGGRLYLFVMWHQRSDARAWFDAWLATIDLTPETATVP